MTETGTIWFNGEMRNSADCTVHVLSHALHYGSSVFEGVRAYETPAGTAVFRLADHIRRLRYSANVYRIPLIYTDDVLNQACRDTIRVNGLSKAYLRPLVMRGNCGLGVLPKKMDVVDVAVIATDWGAYLGEAG